MAKVLTTRQLETIKPAKGAAIRAVPDVAVGGLSVRYGAKGRPAFNLVYRVNGKQIRTKLGYHWSGPDEAPPGWITLRDARLLAASMKEDASRGVGPARATLPPAAAVEDCAAIVERFTRDPNHASLRTALEVDRMLRRAIEPFASKPLADVTKADIRKVLDGYMQDGKGYMANRVFSAFSVFFTWGAERDLIKGNPIVGMSRPMKTEASRDRVLNDAELAAVWHAVGSLHASRRDAIRLLMLTGLRRAEAAEMRWTDIDGDMLVIPADRAKNGVAHVVPLSAQALEVIHARPRTDCPFVFSYNGHRPVMDLSTYQARLARKMSIAGWRLHDLRRSVASGMQELGVEPHVIDACLGHSAVIKGVAAVYLRAKYLDERKAAMTLWGNHVAGLIGSNIVSLHAQRGHPR
jgi:integrase